MLILHKPLENFNLMNARRVLDLLRQREGEIWRAAELRGSTGRIKIEVKEKA